MCESLSPPPEGDGIITDVPGLALSVRFADCQAFAMYAPGRNIIGLIHAGWRGMAANVIPPVHDVIRDSGAIAVIKTRLRGITS